MISGVLHVKILKSWLDYLYPPRCLICRKLIGRGEFLCGSCLESFFFETDTCPICAYAFSPGRECPQCSHRTLYLDGMLALGPYRGNLKKLILEYKYQGKKELVDFFTPFLVQGIASRIQSGQWVAPGGIVPVPLCARRLEERGFNQAELLAKEAASRLNIPLMDVLVRVKDTESQTRLGRRERAANLQGAFCLGEDAMPPGSKERAISQVKSLLLVDDIFTSGATMNEAARVLRQGGVEILYAAVIGR